jgi:hypothetical protein
MFWLTGGGDNESEYHRNNHSGRQQSAEGETSKSRYRSKACQNQHWAPKRHRRIPGVALAIEAEAFGWYRMFDSLADDCWPVHEQGVTETHREHACVSPHRVKPNGSLVSDIETQFVGPPITPHPQHSQQ